MIGHAIAIQVPLPAQHRVDHGATLPRKRPAEVSLVVLIGFFTLDAEAFGRRWSAGSRIGSWNSFIGFGVRLKWRGCHPGDLPDVATTRHGTAGTAAGTSRRRPVRAAGRRRSGP